MGGSTAEGYQNRYIVPPCFSKSGTGAPHENTGFSEKKPGLKYKKTAQNGAPF